jgi:thiamine phosphate synthase YjbQ (UPF0047 family)
MKTYRKELWFETRNRREFQNITATVNECLQESGIQEGLLLCNAMHITSSIFINDDESGLHQDFETWLERLVLISELYDLPFSDYFEQSA